MKTHVGQLEARTNDGRKSERRQLRLWFRSQEMDAVLLIVEALAAPGFRPISAPKRAQPGDKASIRFENRQRFNLTANGLRRNAQPRAALAGGGL